MKIEFYLSEKVLSGFVSCIYCFKGPFTNYEDVKFHFDYDCRKICVSENCKCNKCLKYSFWIVNDFFNVYLNQKNALDYYTEGPKEFWNADVPRIIVREWNGSWQYYDLSTIDAA
jgi:hypothetical protein